MKDVTAWSVRELKRYLRTNGINTNSYKQKTDLIDLATKLLYEDEKAEWIKNVITLTVIALSVLLLNVYIRPKLEKVFWLNPKWLMSWIIVHLITITEKLLTINVILSWILPSTLKEYNIIDKYLIKKLQLFPLSFPLNYDAQTQNASMWIDLYPMLLIYLLRKLKEYVTVHYHYEWYRKYRATYYQQIHDNNAEEIHDDIDTVTEHHRGLLESMDAPNDDFDADLQEALFQSMECDNANQS